MASATVGVLLGYGAARARADGVPPADSLVYSGFLEEGETPVTGKRAVVVSLMDANNTPRCTVSVPKADVQDGRFSVVLTDDCVTAVHQQPDLWVDVQVGDEHLSPRAKVAAVPYALEAGRLNGFRMTQGRVRFDGGTCDSVQSPCVVQLSGFQEPPVCTITMNNPDATGYTEHMVIQEITPTALRLWKGNYQDPGTTMIVSYICVGK